MLPKTREFFGKYFFCKLIGDSKKKLNTIVEFAGGVLTSKILASTAGKY
jgi:hypothetical protein